MDNKEENIDETNIVSDNIKISDEKFDENPINNQTINTINNEINKEINNNPFNDLRTEENVSNNNINNININNTKNNFDNDFEYETVPQYDFEKQKKPISKKLLIIILIAILLSGLVFIVVKFVLKKDNKLEYETVLIDATKKYYNQNKTDDEYGNCSTLTLDEIKNNKLITDDKLKIFKDCDSEKTFVKRCVLSDNSYHYTPTLTCGKKLTTTYEEFKIGNEKSLIANKTDIKFMYSVKQTTLSKTDNKEEEFFEDEIPYEKGTYEVISEKKLYSSRKKSTYWYTEEKQFYPNDETIESKVNSYYTSAPNSTYNNKGQQATVYKWFVGSKQVYNNGEYLSESPSSPYTVKGEEGSSKIYAVTSYPTYLQQKSYRTIESGNIYRTRAVESTNVLQKTLYQCKNPNNNFYYNDSETPCNTEEDTIQGTTSISGYYCIWNNNKTGVEIHSESWTTTECGNTYNYVNEGSNDGWSTWHIESCNYNSNARPYICDRATGYIVTDRVWKWYTPSTKTYYNDSINTKTYYKLSPSAQAIKDESTSTTGYTWYKKATKSLGYSDTKPTSNALNGGTSWTDWSDYTETPITAIKNKQEVRERKKITLKLLIDSNSTWSEISNGYVTEDEVINIVKQKGFDVKSLSDIDKIPNIKYEIIIYYRNQK